MPRGTRPAPLSDAVFNPPGQNLQVKNTFIDMPSGLTPSNMKVGSKPISTAPAELANPPGFLQRAIASGSNPLGATPMDRSALATPSSNAANPLNDPLRKLVMSTPMATIRTPSTSDSLAFPTSSWGNGTLAGASSSYPFPSPKIPPAPAWQANVPVPPSTICATAAQGIASTTTPSTMPLNALLPSDLIGDYDDDGDDDDDDELPPEMRNMADAPKPPPGAEHPSLGSDGHDAGTCKRCCFFPRGRCTNGYNCEFCHYEHEKRKRKNKKKKKKEAAVLNSGTGYPMTSPMVVGQHGTMPASAYSGIELSTPLTAVPVAPPPPLFAPGVQPPVTDAKVLGLIPNGPPQPVYSTAPEPQSFPPVQSYAQPPISPAPLPTPPPGFVAFQASDGRTVFVQESAPGQAPNPSMPLLPPPPVVPNLGASPLSTQPARLQYSDLPSYSSYAQGYTNPPVTVTSVAPAMSALGVPPPPLSTSTAPPYAALAATESMLLPPPMESPKFARTLGGPAVPPPMSSPKLTGNMALSVQQAVVASTAPSL